MVKVNSSHARISVLEKCSNISGLLKNGLIRAAAVLSAAALVSVCVTPAFPAVTVSGLPQWLEANAEKSLTTVWEQMDSSLSINKRKKMIELVAGKLFSGYHISSIKPDKKELEFNFKPLSKGNWKVLFNIPELNESAESWFRADAEKAEKEVAELLKEFPPEALSWADFALERKIDEVMDKYLAGWATGMVVQLKKDVNILKILFSPEPPLVLAFDPLVDSTTIPYVFRSELRKSLLSDLSSFTGLPVVWLQSHKTEFEKLTAARLSKRNTVQNARARVDIDAEPGQISQIQATVESGRYSLSSWLAVYIGADERYPEFGLHLGRITQPFSGWDLELYGEFITKVDDLDLESRLGMRWSPLDNIWLGLEYVDPDDLVWYRILYSGSLKRPYFWWRHSSEREDHFALGWHLTQYLGIELVYDERYEDKWSIRLLNNL